MHTTQKTWTENVVKRKSCFISALFSPSPFLWQHSWYFKSLEYFGWLTVGSRCACRKYPFWIQCFPSTRAWKVLGLRAQDGKCWSAKRHKLLPLSFLWKMLKTCREALFYTLFISFISPLAVHWWWWWLKYSCHFLDEYGQKLILPGDFFLMSHPRYQRIPINCIILLK